MNMLEMLAQAQGGAGLQNLARQFGLDESQVAQVAQQVLPAVSTGFKRQAQEPQGLEAMLRRIQGSDYEDAYQSPEALNRPEIRDRGNDILGQIFGSKDVSRAVAAKAAQNSGVSDSIIKQMLPVIASVVMGGMQRNTTTNAGGMGGALDGILRGLTGGGAQQQQPQRGGGLEDVLGGLLSGAMGGGGSAQAQQSGGGIGGLLGGLLGGGQAQAQSGGGIGGLLGGLLGGAKQAPQQQQQRGGFDPATMGFGAPPAQRRSTGDQGLDGLLGMFDADGDGRVDNDILGQFLNKR